MRSRDDPGLMTTREHLMQLFDEQIYPGRKAVEVTEVERWLRLNLGDAAG
jgi:hypothetical protein